MMKVVKALSYKNKPNPRCAKRLFVGLDDEATEGSWVVKETKKRLNNFPDFFYQNLSLNLNTFQNAED